MCMVYFSFLALLTMVLEHFWNMFIFPVIVLDLNLVVDLQTMFLVIVLAWNLVVEIWSLNSNDCFGGNND